MNTNTDTKFEQVAELIQKAEAIAIFAGAGMGVDSGLEQYRGDDGLWTKSIIINGKAVKYRDLMTHQAFEEVPKKAWGLVASLINKYNSTTPHSGFSELLNLIKDKEYFVITSNCDEHFQKAGFNEESILECHGSVYNMQCMDILEREIWITPEIIFHQENLMAEYPLPCCPNCAGNCRPNIFLFGDWFWVSIKSASQQKRYNKWSKEIKTICKNILAIELGAGKVIPTIRNSAEKFAGQSIPLVRINPNDFEVLSGHHISLPYGAKASILKVAEKINKNYNNIS
ncbi:MAG: SIR2 family NAD-dependent protein deacylase [Bacteroidota bacterium]|jgi:NAD-dependent SIR2 family protein deacetylase